MNEPWSKRHKSDFKGCKYSLSNSFAEPLSHTELVRYTKHEELIRMYNEHDLTYVPNGGSMDLREDIARIIYDSQMSAENILIFPGGTAIISSYHLTQKIFLVCPILLFDLQVRWQSKQHRWPSRETAIQLYSHLDINLLWNLLAGLQKAKELLKLSDIQKMIGR